MKKIAVTLMALVLVLTSAVPVFAAGNFVSSPSYVDFPMLLDCEFTGGCDGELVVTPYSQRDDLNAEEKGNLEKAYQQIKDSDNLNKLFASLNTNKKLLVSELFNIGFAGCEDHNAHNPFTATLRVSTVENFVGVVALVNGKWVPVESRLDGDNVIITSSYYGPYAIVLSEGEGDVPAGDDNPETGDTFPWIYVVLMGVSAAGLVAVLVALKKKNG